MPCVPKLWCLYACDEEKTQTSLFKILWRINLIKKPWPGQSMNCSILEGFFNIKPRTEWQMCVCFGSTIKIFQWVWGAFQFWWGHGFPWIFASQVRPSLLPTWESSSGVTVLPCPGLLHRWGLLDAKRVHYLPESQRSPSSCGVLGSLSIRVAAVLSSSCDRWPGSSQPVGNGIRANSKLFFPQKKKKKKALQPQHSCQLLATYKGEVSYLQRQYLSVLY